MSEWKPIDPLPDFETSDQRKAVGLKKLECPLCQGRRRLEVMSRNLNGDEMVRAFPCHCRLATMFYPMLENVPLHDRWARLHKLKPSKQSPLKEKHERVIELMRKNPNDSYVFLGPPGTYKSTFAAALFSYAVLREAVRCQYDAQYPSYSLSHVWRVSAATLADQFHFRATNRQWVNSEGDVQTAPDPDVTREKIEKAVEKGLRPVLFMYELDKMNMTEFKRHSLFSVFDSLYGAEGQLVIDTNLNMVDLYKFLDGGNEALVSRRVLQRPNTHIIDFF